MYNGRPKETLAGGACVGESARKLCCASWEKINPATMAAVHQAAEMAAHGRP